MLKFLIPESGRGKVSSNKMKNLVSYKACYQGGLNNQEQGLGFGFFEHHPLFS